MRNYIRIFSLFEGLTAVMKQIIVNRTTLQCMNDQDQGHHTVVGPGRELQKG